MPTAKPDGLIGALISGVADSVANVADRVGATVKPAAAVAVATTFSFPLLLMLAVLLFLLGQAHLDHRDPKLRVAPMTAAETAVTFEEEADL